MTDLFTAIVSVIAAVLGIAAVGFLLFALIKPERF